MSKAKEKRRLDDGKLRYLRPADRDRLLNACQSTQERLMFVQCTLMGLRNAEVVHLSWGSWKRDREPHELHVLFVEPDADDPKGWQPKTGERDPQIVWPLVTDLLEEWYAATPFGRADADPIIANPRSGKRYRELPRVWIERLQRETGIDWTPQVGRRIACSILPVHMEQRTGKPWPSDEHERFFGHTTAVARTYYEERSRNRVRHEEADASTGTSRRPAPEPGFLELTSDLQRRLLDRLLDDTGLSVNALAQELGIAETAIRKFRTGKSRTARWIWSALDLLLVSTR